MPRTRHARTYVIALRRDKDDAKPSLSVCARSRQGAVHRAMAKLNKRRPADGQLVAKDLVAVSTVEIARKTAKKAKLPIVRCMKCGAPASRIQTVLHLGGGAGPCQWCARKRWGSYGAKSPGRFALIGKKSPQ